MIALRRHAGARPVAGSAARLARRRMAGLALLAGVALAPGHAGGETWNAGGLTFSDELGGARLIGASGSGTRDDPIVLLEEISGPGPAILVVRNHRTGHLDLSPALGFLSISVVKIVANRGASAWAGFDLELRRSLEQPSIYTDGLSFDQPRAFARAARADRFAQTLQDDEPFDRIRFDGGNVEPTQYLRLDFDIVDVNGAALFYLVQQPIVLLARHDRPDTQHRLSSAQEVPQAIQAARQPSPTPRPPG
jgi:hypothetical protein